jgi:hypothetical protein
MCCTESKRFFFEKKKQKTYSMTDRAVETAMAQNSKQPWFSKQSAFFEKNRLLA